MTALQAGQPGECERWAREALAQVPDEPSALGLLAFALSQQQRCLEALPLFEQLVSLQPLVASHWSNLGNCLCELGREREAREPLQRAAQLGDHSDARCYAAARAELAHARPQAALPLIQQALSLQPDDPEYQLLLARIWVLLDRHERAGAIIDRLHAAALPPELRIDAGFVLLQIGLFADAARCFSSVLDARPEAVDALLGLAQASERCNRLELAADALARVAARPQPLSDRQQRLQLDVQAQLDARAQRHAEACAGLEQLLADTALEPVLRAELLLRLGRGRDALGAASASMQALDDGHALRARWLRDAHGDALPGDGLRELLQAPLPLLPRALHEFPAEDDLVDPLFVVGFPRSGTTLLEQLLDAHPALASFDEQPLLQQLCSAMEAGGLRFPQDLDRLPRERMLQLRQRYANELRRLRPDLGLRRAVDKNPLNLARLALVATLFPKAQVVLALRHPCDVVLSCYQQDFRSPALALGFETLLGTARLYHEVMRQHHDHVDRLGLSLQVLRYEDLVADVEGEARRLLAFLDLPWEPTLLRFTERARDKASISTPSYSQVVQPVNRRAVGRWQRYRPWFEGAVLDTLRPWIERFGYSCDS